MKRAAVDGLELEYGLRGSGEPVVLIHWGVSATWAEPLHEEPALADSYRLLSYHRAGFGSSSQIEGPVTMADHAEHCRLIMRHLGIERAHIVGHSSSVAVALQLALDAPEVVHTLVLMDAARPAPTTELQAAFRRGVRRARRRAPPSRRQERRGRHVLSRRLRPRLPRPARSFANTASKTASNDDSATSPSTPTTSNRPMSSSSTESSAATPTTPHSSPPSPHTRADSSSSATRHETSPHAWPSRSPTSASSYDAPSSESLCTHPRPSSRHSSSTGSARPTATTASPGTSPDSNAPPTPEPPPTNAPRRRSSEHRLECCCDRRSLRAVVS
jgi:pimeloyl-ACP methyl ester carboxylesterase